MSKTRLFGSPVIEALVVALLVGMLVRLVWQPSAQFDPGIRFAGKQVLELSVAILGVIVVLGLPLLVGPLRLSNYQYGVLAGLSVYAVPQVVRTVARAGSRVIVAVSLSLLLLIVLGVGFIHLLNIR